MAILLSGETIAEGILKRLEKQKFLKKPKLVVVQVGDDTASTKYIAEKEKASERIGIGFSHVYLPKGISEKKLKQEIEKAAKEATGIIVQLPLPSRFHVQEILDAIPFEKDVDLLSSKSFGLFALRQLPVLPPTVKAISLLLKRYHIVLQDKKVVMVGAGRLVGLPTSSWLLAQRASVQIADKKTKNLSILTRQADIIISGTGRKNLIRGDMIKRGAVVIDAAQDIDFNTVVRKAKYISPVPGGVGPLTVACLLENVVDYSTRSFI